MSQNNRACSNECFVKVFVMFVAFFLSLLYTGTVFLTQFTFSHFILVSITRMGQCDRGGKGPNQENAHCRPK